MIQIEATTRRMESVCPPSVENTSKYKYRRVSLRVAVPGIYTIRYSVGERWEELHPPRDTTVVVGQRPEGFEGGAGIHSGIPSIGFSNLSVYFGFPETCS